VWWVWEKNVCARYKLHAYAPCLFVYAAHRRRARCSVVTGLSGYGVMLIGLTSWGVTHGTALNTLMQDHVPWKTVRDVHQTYSVCTNKSMLKSKYCSLMPFSLKVLGHLLAWVFDVWIEKEMMCIINVGASYVYARNKSDLSSCDPRSPIQVIFKYSDASANEDNSFRNHIR
jgi:hypothetical protein